MDNPTPFDQAPAHDGGMKFADMTRVQKYLFVTKVVICVATMGFAFPNVQHRP